MNVRRFTMLLVLFALLPVGDLAAAPRIVFDKEVHDYGKVRVGETVVEEFVFKNEGDGTLTIGDLRSDCGCTKAVEGSREVPPKGQSKIKALFDTTGLKAGRKQKRVFVHSNDPQRPVVVLTVLADVIKEIYVQPATLRQVLGPQETVTFEAKITNTSKKNLTVRGLDTTHTEGAEVRVEPQRFVVDAGQTLPFTVTIKPRKEPGRKFYVGRFFLQTDHPAEKALEIPYIVKTGDVK
jgi:hypothetical protein